MEYGITADGFSMRRLDEIYNDSCKRFEDEIGVNPSENPQSLMNVLLRFCRCPGGIVGGICG